MYKPAARKGDTTNHGGTITTGCCETVLINGIAAARLGDTTTCPATSPTPHVGGPIVNASSSVLIGGMPAARQGDQAACTGPVDTIAMGCPTVLIGEKAGSSSTTKKAEEGETPSGPTTTHSYKVLSRDKPLKNAQVRLFIDGQEHTVQTNGEGAIEQDFPADAGICYIMLTREPEGGGEGEADSEESTEELHIPLLVGTLKELNPARALEDPHAEEAARQRLVQLGFMELRTPHHFEVALKDFQLYKGVDPNGIIDSETCDPLREYIEEAE